MSVLFAVLFILFPALLVFLCNKFKALDKVGIVLLCYICGMIIGNIPGLLPQSFITSPADGESVLELIQSITICVARPLVLFSLNLREWFKMAKKGMLCMLLACVSIVIVSFFINLALAGGNEHSPEYAAAAVSVYTGGTVNLGSIKTAIGMSENDYIIFNTYDAIISVLYIFFLSTVGRKFFQRVFKLKPFEFSSKGVSDVSENSIDEGVNSYSALLKKQNLGGLAVALLLSIGIFGVSYVLNMLVSKINAGLGMTVMMLSITSLGIGMSFIPKIRNIRHTFQLGMYIIYIFCFSVAASADFMALINFDLTIFLYVAVSIVGSLLLHALLCKLAGIDSDTLIITSTSAVCSPPFVPAVSAALKNKEVLISGLATGVVGYAIGNYLGIGVYYLYKLI